MLGPRSLLWIIVLTIRGLTQKLWLVKHKSTVDLEWGSYWGKVTEWEISCQQSNWEASSRDFKDYFKDKWNEMAFGDLIAKLKIEEFNKVVEKKEYIMSFAKVNVVKH